MVKRLLLTAVATGCLLTAAKAADGNIAADTSRVFDLDEIVVVAQSKEFVKLRRQPLSSTVLTSNELSALGVRDLRDVSDFVPSMVMPSYGSRYTSSIYVRGIGSRINSPSMGIYVDNIPLVSKAAFNSHFYQTDRVDVLRGAQGTLYGINTEGGLLRQYTKSPMKYEGTDISLGAATNFYRNVEAAHYHKFGDALALSVAAFYNGEDGFLKNTATGDRADKRDEAGGRLRLFAKPSDRLTIDLTADYQWVRQNGFGYGLLDTQTEKAADPNTNRQGTYRRNMLNTGVSIGYAGDWADLSYTLSYQFLKDNMLIDIDYRPQDYMHMEQAQLQNALTHELVLKSHQLGRWQGTTGLFFSHQWLKTDAPVYFDPAMNQFLSETIENYAYTGMLNAMAARMGTDAAAAMIARAGGCHITMETETIPGLFRTPQTNYGLFHESHIKLGSRLTATLGLRYDLTETQIDYRTSATAHLDENVMGTRVQAAVRSLLEHKEQASFEQWLPKVGLTLQTDSRGSNVYAIVSKGYRAGGFNIQMFSDILQAELQGAARSARGDMQIAHSESDYSNIRKTIEYKPEESWNFEFGTHQNVADGLHIDLSAYYMQIRNQQLSVFASQYGFGRMMVNAGKSYSCGIEATMRGSLLDDRLAWTLSYGYTHAVFKNYTDSVTTASGSVATDYSGKRVPFVPQHTLAAQADYRIDIGGRLLKSITLGASVTAQGRTWWDEANTYGQKFYALPGAHVDAELGNIRLSVWGRNLANTRYNTFALKSSFGGNTSCFAQQGAPLQVGVDAKIHF